MPSREMRRARIGRRMVAASIALLLACDPPPDRHSAAPASIEPERSSRGHVHLAATRIAEGTRAELDTLLSVDSAAVVSRLPSYLAHAAETLEALEAEMSYFTMADSVWIALADSVARDLALMSSAPNARNLLPVHGDRFRRLLDHSEELHDSR